MAVDYRDPASFSVPANQPERLTWAPWGAFDWLETPGKQPILSFYVKSDRVILLCGKVVYHLLVDGPPPQWLLVTANPEPLKLMGVCSESEFKARFRRGICLTLYEGPPPDQVAFFKACGFVLPDPALADDLWQNCIEPSLIEGWRRRAQGLAFIPDIVTEWDKLQPRLAGAFQTTTPVLQDPVFQGLDEADWMTRVRRAVYQLANEKGPTFQRFCEVAPFVATLPLASVYPQIQAMILAVIRARDAMTTGPNRDLTTVARMATLREIDAFAKLIDSVKRGAVGLGIKNIERISGSGRSSPMFVGEDPRTQPTPPPFRQTTRIQQTKRPAQPREQPKPADAPAPPLGFRRAYFED